MVQYVIHAKPGRLALAQPPGQQHRQTAWTLTTTRPRSERDGIIIAVIISIIVISSTSISSSVSSLIISNATRQNGRRLRRGPAPKYKRAHSKIILRRVCGHILKPC